MNDTFNISPDSNLTFDNTTAIPKSKQWHACVDGDEGADFSWSYICIAILIVVMFMIAGFIVSLFRKTQDEKRQSLKSIFRWHDTISSYCASNNERFASKTRLFLLITNFTGISLLALHSEEFNSRENDSEGSRYYWYGIEIFCMVCMCLVSIFHSQSEKWDEEHKGCDAGCCNIGIECSQVIHSLTAGVVFVVLPCINAFYTCHLMWHRKQRIKDSGCSGKAKFIWIGFGLSFFNILALLIFLIIHGCIATPIKIKIKKRRRRGEFSLFSRSRRSRKSRKSRKSSKRREHEAILMHEKNDQKDDRETNHTQLTKDMNYDDDIELNNEKFENEKFDVYIQMSISNMSNHFEQLGEGSDDVASLETPQRDEKIDSENSKIVEQNETRISIHYKIFAASFVAECVLAILTILTDTYCTLKRNNNFRWIY